jgi:hypothetical protein
MGSPLDQWDMVRMKWDCRLSTGLPPSSRLHRLRSRKGDLQWEWNQDRKAVWDQVGLSHCWHNGLVTVRDEARLRRGHNDQSRCSHQCSEAMLTEEFWFHISTPQGIWTWVPCDGKQMGSLLDQWDMVRMKWDCRLSTCSSFKEARICHLQSLLPALLCVLSCRPFLPLFYLYLCEQRLYSQTQCLWSMIHDFSNADIFIVILIPSEVVFRARNWSQLNDCDQIIQRPYSEWGNYHNQMVKINWSRFSYWKFSIFTNNLQHENSTNQEEDTDTCRKCTYWPMHGTTAITVK